MGLSFEQDRQPLIQRELRSKDFSLSIVLGTPPPPTNLTHTDVTKTKIEIVWDKPIAHELFAIDGYTVSHKASTEKEFKTENITTGESNAVLNDLNEGTFYIITVRGYNNEGNGDELKIEVKTEKTEGCKCKRNPFIV
jgi:hypothetical protein